MSSILPSQRLGFEVTEFDMHGASLDPLSADVAKFENDDLTRDTFNGNRLVQMNYSYSGIVLTRDERGDRSNTKRVSCQPCGLHIVATA